MFQGEAWFFSVSDSDAKRSHRHRCRAGWASRPWCISWLHNLWVSPGEMRFRESHAECEASVWITDRQCLYPFSKFPRGLLKHHRLVFKLESWEAQLCLEWISALMWIRVADSDMKGAFSPPTLASIVISQWLERTNWVANKKQVIQNT